MELINLTTAEEKIQLLTDSKYKVELISIVITQVKNEIESYINKSYSDTMENILIDMVIFKLNRRGAEGISTQSYSGASETFTSDYPLHISRQLDRLRLSGRKKWGIL